MMTTPSGSERERTSITSLCLVQAEDRPLLRDRTTATNSGPVGTTGVAALLATNRALCAADSNCTYVRHDGAYKHIQPHWRKVFVGSHVLNTSRCPAIAWLDSDAVLAGPPSDLLSLLRPRVMEGGGVRVPIEQAEDRRYVWPTGVSRLPMLKSVHDIHFVGAGEGNIWNANLSPFNAGVWIVANTRLGRAIMAKWVAAYTDHAAAHWSHDPAGKHTGQDDLSWRCTEPDKERPGQTRTCGFSKEYYEQGAFVKIVLGERRFRHAIRLVPWHVLQSPHPHPMVHHFIGPPRTKEKYMRDYLPYRGPSQGAGVRVQAP
jgi:hypothetical protein